jgi:hypothetical protein
MSEFLKLYRSILRLHRLLPAELRVLGDNYVKNEFRLHFHVKDEPVLLTFFKEWSQYHWNLIGQLEADLVGIQGPLLQPLGKKLEFKRLSEFNDDQLHNLMELRKNASIQEVKVRAEKENK